MSAVTDFPNLMESPSGPETVIDGRRYLYFGGTSYLGLQARSEVIAAGCAALREYGLHTGTSRAGFGTSRPLREVEARAAAFFGTEDAFYFGSGYVANHIMVSALAAETDRIVLDEAAHFCVREAARVAGIEVRTFAHRDPDDLARQIDGRDRVLVMADAVGPSSGTLAPVRKYLDVLSRLDGASLLLDDAHGFGVLGGNGRGLLDALGLWPHANGGKPLNGVRLFICGTLAKALGGFGGIIPGTRAFVESARKSSHYFDGASPMPPAIAASSATALAIVEREPELRERLRENVVRFRAGLRALGLEVPEGETAQLGLSLENAERMRQIHRELRARGLLLPYIPAYSGIPACGVLRFALFANHTAGQIDRLLGELGDLL